ncbi:LysR substrate-binding domain-containing protein [Variovorax sp. E3]|uniref:LysR family transcriptional regulator n=1 Tax=Variovorax sp. E3 TaxID=1914993 RepID=UPI0018DB85AE|nr:LysR substrate-binding domain-containing protein [Variovorax sp. E3]
MDLRQLRYFLLVAEAGGFTRAAERAHVAQPALSSHVARLEDELGVRLFARTSKGVELTPAGKALSEHGHELFRSVELAKDAARHAGEDVQGNVALGLPCTISMVLTLPLVTQVRRNWPRVALRLVEAHSGWLLEWLLDGRLDAAVLFDAPARKGLKTVPLLDEDLFLVSPIRAAGERDGDTATMDEVASLPLLLPARGHGLRTVIERAAQAADLQLNVEVEIDALANIKKAVAAGLGHTILSHAAIAGELQRQEVRVRRIVDPVVMRTAVLAFRNERAPSFARDKVLEAMRLQVTELVQSGSWPARLHV